MKGRDLKKTFVKDVIPNTRMSDARICKDCQESKTIDDFEATTKDGKSRRGVCRTCYAKKKSLKAKVAALTHDPGKVLKPDACNHCGKGPNEVDFKWRSDLAKGGWRNTCTTCYNAKAYHKAYRERERVKDEAGYLARNASIHLAWAHRNPDKVKEQQIKAATEEDRKIKSIKTSATQREIGFNDADARAMQRKLTRACHFCGFKPSPTESLNGLDRVDAALGYTDANTVSCCATCNAMKCIMHVDDFLSNVRAIAKHTGRTETYEGCRNRLTPFAGTTDRREAEVIDKDMKSLSPELKLTLWSSLCYLCGRTPAFGIDRVDPHQGYVPSNVRPCCSSCNYMKKDLQLDDFMAHIAFINKHTKDWTVGDIMDMPIRAFGGHLREPVSVFDNNNTPMIVFPSKTTASKIIGVCLRTLEKALTSGTKCRGHTWSTVEPRQYRAQYILPDDARQVIQHLQTK